MRLSMVHFTECKDDFFYFLFFFASRDGEEYIFASSVSSFDDHDMLGTMLANK